MRNILYRLLALDREGFLAFPLFMAILYAAFYLATCTEIAWLKCWIGHLL